MTKLEQASVADSSAPGGGHPLRELGSVRQRGQAPNPSTTGRFTMRKLRGQLEFGLLRDHRVRRLAWAHFTSAAGDAMVLAALPFAIRAAGGSDEQFAVALAVEGLAMAFLFLPSGVIADRFNRKRVVVASDLMRFGARGAFVALLLTGHAAYWQLLFAQGINGVGTALFNTTMDRFVPEVFNEPDSRLQRINALRFLALSLGLSLGPAIGSLVYSAGGAASTFMIDAFTFLVSAALIRRLPTPFAKAALEPATLRTLITDAREGWKAFRGIRWYWLIVAEAAVVNGLVFAPYFVIGPHVANESLGGSVGWAGILVGLGAGELLGSLIAMAWEPRRPLLFSTAVVAGWVVPLLLMAAVAPIPLLCAGAILAGICSATSISVWETVKQTRTPAHLRARLGSFDHLGSLGPVPLGYLFGGMVLAAVGSTTALIVSALILAAVTATVITDSSIRSLVTFDDRREGRTGHIVDVALVGAASK